MARAPRSHILKARWLAVLLAWLLWTPVWADHGAPAPQLGGVRLCADAGSVHLRLEGVPLRDNARARVREAVLGRLTRTLEAAEIPAGDACTGSNGFVLIALDLRYLDPETYLGFPENSYTYVSAAQVGAAPSGAETALREGRYSASASDIIQAEGSAEVEAQLLALGEAQIDALVQAWLEANRVAARSYLLFAGLGTALAALWVLGAALR